MMTNHATRENALVATAIAEALRGLDAACPFAVTRDGELEPCSKPVVAVVVHEWEGAWWHAAACLHHAHQSGKANVVPLADVIAAAKEADR